MATSNLAGLGELEREHELRAALVAAALSNAHGLELDRRAMLDAANYDLVVTEVPGRDILRVHAVKRGP